MVSIKPGEKGVVHITAFSSGAIMQAYAYVDTYMMDIASGLVANGAVNSQGYTVSWSPFTAVPNGPGAGYNGVVDVVIEVPQNATSGERHISIFSANVAGENEECAEGISQFLVPGPLTGSVSPSSISGLQACVDLKADASKDQKVTDAEINWGDGNTTTVSPAPNTQYYFGHECHTYATAGTYTITVTYKDDASPHNSINPNTFVTVGCISSASMSIKSTGSSNGKNPTKGIYTYCYTATVSHSTAAGESFSYDWTFPDNTTVNSGGGSSDQTASFCIATADINWQSNFGVVSCKITKTTPTPPCDVTVSGQLASPGGPPPPPPPPGPPPGDPPGAPGNPPC